MQAVILAAGRGTRLRPLTDTIPKPLLPVAGVSIIERTLRELPGAITEVIIVTGYLGAQFREHFGDSYYNLPLTYIEQSGMLGTAGALHSAKPYLHDKFLVLNGDDIYTKTDLNKLITYPLALLATANHPGNNVIVDAQDHFTGIGTAGESSHYLTNCGAYVLNTDFFTYRSAAITDGDNPEYGLPQTLASMTHDHPITVVRATTWLPVGTPEQLADAEQYFKTTS